MSRTGGRDVTVAMRDCGISTTSRTRPVCKHCFSALPIDKTSSVEAQIGLLWRSFCSSSYRVWDYCEKPLGAGFRSVNPALEVLRESRSGLSPRGILAPPLSGIHRSESSPSGFFAIKYTVMLRTLIQKPQPQPWLCQFDLSRALDGNWVRSCVIFISLGGQFIKNCLPQVFGIKVAKYFPLI